MLLLYKYFNGDVIKVFTMSRDYNNYGNNNDDNDKDIAHNNKNH